MGEEEWECSYIMANALCPCAVSAGRWCIAQQSRTNGQMKKGRAGDGKSVVGDGGTSHLNDGRMTAKLPPCLIHTVVFVEIVSQMLPFTTSRQCLFNSDHVITS